MLKQRKIDKEATGGQKRDLHCLVMKQENSSVLFFQNIE